MSDRPTASTINDIQLDALYAELAEAQARLAHARALHQDNCPFATGALPRGFYCSLCEALSENASPGQPAADTVTA